MRFRTLQGTKKQSVRRRRSGLSSRRALIGVLLAGLVVAAVVWRLGGREDLAAGQITAPWSPQPESPITSTSDTIIAASRNEVKDKERVTDGFLVALIEEQGNRVEGATVWIKEALQDLVWVDRAS
jgi:hypothetical protein